MSINNPYAKYQNNSVITASKEELTLMLYEGALRFCNQAIAAIEEKDINKAHNSIIRVQEIIEEFIITLNMSYDVSANFKSLYDYMYLRLVEANVSKNKEIVMEVRDLFREFRDMWKEAMRLAKQPKQ